MSIVTEHFIYNIFIFIEGIKMDFMLILHALAL